MLHCCADDLPFPLLRSVPLRALSFDVEALPERRYDELADWLDRGRDLWPGVVPSTEPEGRPPTAAMQERLDQIATMLERARTRGERPPALWDVMDHLLAPLYVRALFGTPASEAFAEKLVERLLGMNE